MLNRDKILKVNRSGINNPDAFWSYYTPSLQVAFELGQRGVDLSSQPDVIGERYGSVPQSGLSLNYRNQISERGLSLANIDGQEEVGSVIWFAEREKVRVSGLLLPYKGSDGEPLILAYGIEDLD